MLKRIAKHLLHNSDVRILKDPDGGYLVFVWWRGRYWLVRQTRTAKEAADHARYCWDRIRAGALR